MKTGTNLICAPLPLWRNSPPPTLPGEASIGSGLVFPSGRQALTRALNLFGLGRKDRVALPEWSSACVINAVSRQAFPLPIKEVLAHRISVQALVLYEQWGWPFPENVLNRIFDEFPGVKVVLDKVDSAPLYFAETDGGRQLAEIWSLSKVLGLRGGGLLRLNDEWSVPEFEQQDTARLAAMEAMEDAVFVDEIAKTDIACVPGAVLEYVEGCNLEGVYRREAEARRENLSTVAVFPAAKGWDDWMKKALNKKYSPGIAPLFRGQGKDRLQEIAAVLAARQGIETKPYHFNFSGDPLNPAYEMCLAMPIHGMLTTDLIAAALEHLN